jgi:CMP/dCMP kinase
MAEGRERGIIVAIDGPAAAGKSSTASEVADRLGYVHLDTGALYRAATLALLRAGTPEEEWEAVDRPALEGLGIEARLTGGGLRVRIGDGPVDEVLRSPAVNAGVSRVAAVPAVRGWALERLRAIGAEGGVVADGRDIGTVVFPAAELKVFLVCDPEERARRRILQQGGEVDDAALREEAARLRERDRLDTEREVAPLLRAADAVLLDTTFLDFEAQVEIIVRLARERSR